MLRNSILGTKMKIFCHPDNVNSLKLLIAKEVGGVTNVALESVHPETKVVPYLTSPTLPVLQLRDDEVRKNSRKSVTWSTVPYAPLLVS